MIDTLLALAIVFALSEGVYVVARLIGEFDAHWFWPCEIISKAREKRNRPKIGACRIVEMLDKEGNPYYVVEKFEKWSSFADPEWGLQYGTYDSVESAQEAVNKDRDEEARKNYRKVMGEL